MTHIAGHDLFLGVDNGRWASGCIDASARTYRADFRSAFRPYNGAYLYRLDEHCRGGPTGSAYNAGRRDRLQSGLGSHRCNHVSHGVCLADRAADQRTIAKVHQAATPEEARAAIADRLPSLVASVLTPADLDRVHSTLSKVTTAKTRAGLKREDWLGAAAVFVLVFGSTMPILVPVPACAGCPNCASDLKLNRHCDNADRGLRVRTPGRIPAVVDGRFHGFARLPVGCADHRVRRLRDRGWSAAHVLFCRTNRSGRTRRSNLRHQHRAMACFLDCRNFRLVPCQVHQFVPI